MGTGFSYTENNSTFATTNAQIASDLMEVMQSFYRKLPRFRSVPVYIASQSYGGKMAAEFALVWYKVKKHREIFGIIENIYLMQKIISAKV